jgi:nucleotide-binding universal stress UspA family protein
LYKNVLIPTDGSDLAAKAVGQGVLFVKEIGAKITAIDGLRAVPYALSRAEPT